MKKGRLCFEKQAAPIFDHPMFDFLKNVSFLAISDMKSDAFPPMFLYELNEELRRIKKG